MLLPSGSVKKFAEKIQKDISSHFNIYYERSYPEMHLTVNKINKDVEHKKAVKIIEDVCSKVNPVKIKIEEFDCLFNYENNFLVLKVARTESLMKFAGKLHRVLKQKGMTVIENFDNWEFHITLISNHFAKNPLDKKDFSNLYRFYSGVNLPCMATTNRVELWRFTVDPSRKCIAQFEL